MDEMHTDFMVVELPAQWDGQTNRPRGGTEESVGCTEWRNLTQTRDQGGILGGSYV